ncbi:hypothetical protein RBXJA2T_01935 [Rubrivivax benzoatilyticus JA2 = ATCC BAA-35]|nr:hypothetical protein RBXJA2T_01935 [Rubrivivax benzoatilyticus JA2 = ATCC BAA-35]
MCVVVWRQAFGASGPGRLKFPVDDPFLHAIGRWQRAAHSSELEATARAAMDAFFIEAALGFAARGYVCCVGEDDVADAARRFRPKAV